MVFNRSHFRAIAAFCDYLLRYRINYQSIRNTHLGGFKSHHKENNVLVREVLEDDFSINNLTSSVHKLLTESAQDIFNVSMFIILCDLINGKFVLNDSTLSDEQLKELTDVRSNILKSQSNDPTFQTLFDLTNRELSDQDSSDLDILIDSILHRHSTQSINASHSLNQTLPLMGSTPMTATTIALTTTTTTTTTSIITSATNTTAAVSAETLAVIASINARSTQHTPPDMEMVKKLLDEYHIRNEKLIETKFAMINNILVTNENVECYINSIDELLLKHGRLLNHARLTQSHLDAKTAPASLSHLRFPKPMFQDDPIFVENYSLFLNQMQEQFLTFQKAQIQIKIDKAEADLSNLKQLIAVKVPNVDKIFHDRKIEAELLLKDEFINSDNKVKSIITNKWQSTNSLRVKNNQKNKNSKKSHQNRQNRAQSESEAKQINNVQFMPPVFSHGPSFAKQPPDNNFSSHAQHNSFQSQMFTPRQQQQKRRPGQTYPILRPSLVTNGPAINMVQTHTSRMPVLHQNGNFRVRPQLTQLR